jgi:hypothetical protein
MAVDSRWQDRLSETGDVMRGTFSAKPLAGGALVLAALLVTLAGCSSGSHKQIDVIGVLASGGSTIVGSDTVYTYTFDDGRTYTLTYEGHVLLGGQPSTGDLLIAGSKPSNWILVATPKHPAPEAPADCFATPESYGEVHDTSVDLGDGVTLPKAPDFASGNEYPAGDHFASATVCLDRQGRVTWIGSGRG